MPGVMTVMFSYMRGAIREAGTPTYRSRYTRLLLSCNGGDQCWDLYQQNFTNSLVTLYTFTFLKPNTSYALNILGCYQCCEVCSVGRNVLFKLQCEHNNLSKQVTKFLRRMEVIEAALHMQCTLLISALGRAVPLG